MDLSSRVYVGTGEGGPGTQPDLRVQNDNRIFNSEGKTVHTDTR